MDTRSTDAYSFAAAAARAAYHPNQGWAKISASEITGNKSRFVSTPNPESNTRRIPSRGVPVPIAASASARQSDVFELRRAARTERLERLIAGNVGAIAVAQLSVSAAYRPMSLHSEPATHNEVVTSLQSPHIDIEA